MSTITDLLTQGRSRSQWPSSLVGVLPATGAEDQATSANQWRIDALRAQLLQLQRLATELRGLATRTSHDPEVESTAAATIRTMTDGVVLLHLRCVRAMAVLARMPHHRHAEDGGMTEAVRETARAALVSVDGCAASLRDRKVRAPEPHTHTSTAVVATAGAVAGAAAHTRPICCAALDEALRSARRRLALLIASGPAHMDEAGQL